MNEQLSFFVEPNNTESNNTNAKCTYYCMFNGVYGEHSPEEMGLHCGQVEQTLSLQKEAYKKYIGKVVGDFTCKCIDYDWGTHRQIWTVKCNTCGKEKKIENGYQWGRGKTGSNHCECWHEQKKANKQAAKKLAEESRKENIKRREERQRELESEVGKTYGAFKVVECYSFGNGGCVVQCVNCGKKIKSRSINQLRRGDYPTCNGCGENARKTYTNEQKWIGVRNGHLVSEKVEDGMVLCRCDCGNMRRVNPTSFFKYHIFSNCADPKCVYANDTAKKAYNARLSGKEFEFMTEVLLHTEGYKTEYIGKSGDFGVDIIATGADGTRIAVQCKCNAHSRTGIGAIQEVYAGGRYYGLEHFAVVSYGEISKNAVRMAKKLGVYISDGKEFVFPENMKEYTKMLIPTVKTQKQEKLRKLYELNGEWDTLPNWAFKYETSEDYIRRGLKRGLSFENALKYKPYSKKKQYTVNGITGTITELCNHFRIVSAATAMSRYQSGHSIEEAVLMKKMQPGRPHKSEQKYANDFTEQLSLQL